MGLVSKSLDKSSNYKHGFFFLFGILELGKGLLNDGPFYDAEFGILFSGIFLVRHRNDRKRFILKREGAKNKTADSGGSRLFLFGLRSCIKQQHRWNNASSAILNLVTNNRYRIGAGIGNCYFTADVPNGIAPAEVILTGQNHFAATHGTHAVQASFPMIRSV